MARFGYGVLGARVPLSDSALTPHTSIQLTSTPNNRRSAIPKCLASGPVKISATIPPIAQNRVGRAMADHDASLLKLDESMNITATVATNVMTPQTLWTMLAAVWA